MRWRVCADSSATRPAPAQVRARLRLLDDPERTLLVAGPAGGVAGFIDVHVQRTVEEEPFAEVGGLVVAAEHRAQVWGPP